MIFVQKLIFLGHSIKKILCILFVLFCVAAPVHASDDDGGDGKENSGNQGNGDDDDGQGGSSGDDGEEGGGDDDDGEGGDADDDQNSSFSLSEYQSFLTEIQTKSKKLVGLTSSATKQAKTVKKKTVKKAQTTLNKLQEIISEMEGLKTDLATKTKELAAAKSNRDYKNQKQEIQSLLKEYETVRAANYPSSGMITGNGSLRLAQKASKNLEKAINKAKTGKDDKKKRKKKKSMRKGKG